VSAATTRFRSPDEQRAILALSLAAEVGPVGHRELLERFRSAARAIDSAVDPRAAAQAYAAADSALAAAAAADLGITTVADDEYPPQLLHLHDPPPVLWSRGAWSTLAEPVVAIVGTRRATSYGLRVTRELASAFTRARACVVSGMALGIDACAHRTALDGGGRTVAVLGTGANIAYPRAHSALHRQIAAAGLVLSERPPGAKSDLGSFPRRNRIIAALVRLVIVVEAPESSGALNTAKHAYNLGRDVGAVPGPIDSPQSVGTNQLIRDGAHAITSVADALALAGLEFRAPPAPVLNGDDEVRVWNALERSVASLDELCARAALPVTRCLTAVTALELRGIIECALTGDVRRR